MAATAANDVFELPELLEKILVLIPPLEILHVMLVSRRWKDTVVGSPSLRKLLGLRPLSTAKLSGLKPLSSPNFYSPFLLNAPDENGWLPPAPSAEKLCNQEPYMPFGKLEDKVHRARFYPGGKDLPPRAVFIIHTLEDRIHPLEERIGSRVRDMAICSPPARTIDINIKCDCCHEFMEGDERERSNTTTSYGYTSAKPRGFTIGYLARKIRHVLNTKHVECRSRRVSILAYADLSPEDPILKTQAAAMKAYKDAHAGEEPDIRDDGYDQYDYDPYDNDDDFEGPCDYCEAFRESFDMTSFM